MPSKKIARQLPLVEPLRAARAAPERGLVFAVYAPFGGDAQLSRYPRLDPAAPIPPIRKQALVRQLLRVAAEGVNVCALIDLYDDFTWLVEIPAWEPAQATFTSAWKQDMADRHALESFLIRAHARFPCAALVLALEGHGGGFVPDIDFARITPASASNYRDAANQPQRVKWVSGESRTTFEPDGSPPLPMASPMLPMASPMLPASNLPMSTWGLGEALRCAIAAGVPRPAVIHFNNCFNASVELLHTVAPHADYATGYANYDFFTAGEAYPPVFRQLRLAGSASREQLARWFALANGKLLKAKGNHPIVGATVPLQRLRAPAGVADRLATLSCRLTAGLSGSREAATREAVRLAARDAQHYDTVPGYELKVPDQFIDIGSFARALAQRFAALDPDIATAATDLQNAVSGVWQWGDDDWPWMGHDPALRYDFSDKLLGLNIFFPDPVLEGLWDWRSPYYLSGTVNPAKPPAHRHVIPFLADVAGKAPAWVEFIIAYHRSTPLVGFHAPRPFVFPVFNRDYDPKPDLDPKNPTGGPRK